jgi:tight adherence protein C
MPDMMDMLMISVEAGLGFDAAVSKYVGNNTGPLSQEFRIVLSEIQAGMSRREALRHAADRTEVPELSAFVMAMVQADIFGISVANVLRGQSHEMRLRRRQLAEEIAQKAPAKMVFPLIICILPATLIVLMGPAVIQIGRTFGMLGG